MLQPEIQKALMQRLARVATAYEMTVGKMLTFILISALEELEGKQDDYTICMPISPEGNVEQA